MEQDISFIPQEDQNNLTIAKFMGAKLEVYPPNGSYIGEIKITNKEQIGVVSSYPLYDQDWNLLMNVVEKIESMGYAVMITQNICTIKSSDIRATSQKPIVSIASDYQGANTKISNTYKAILEFIDYLRQVNNSQDML